MQKFNVEAARHLYIRFADPDITYTEFSKMVLPQDPSAHNMVVCRRPSKKIGMSEETLEILKSLIRAQMSLV